MPIGVTGIKFCNIFGTTHSTKYILCSWMGIVGSFHSFIKFFRVNTYCLWPLGFCTRNKLFTQSVGSLTAWIIFISIILSNSAFHFPRSAYGICLGRLTSGGWFVSITIWCFSGKHPISLNNLEILWGN